MRLVHFEVENFRSIRERVVLSNLGPVEVLHGPNNAGKSNILRALALAWRLLLDARLRQAPEARHDRPLADLGLTEPPFHRGWEDRPCHLRMLLEDPDLIAEFQMVASEVGVSVKVSLTGNVAPPPEPAPLADDEEPRPLASRTLREANEESAAGLGLPWPPFVLVDTLSRPPDDAATWDTWLLDRRDQDPGGQYRRRFAAVQEALRSYDSELGTGRLDRFSSPRTRGLRGEGPPRVELAWESDDGVPRPFSEQGSGLQRLKDLLVAILGTPAPFVAIEQPEDHLSESAQSRLYDIIAHAAREGGKQVLLTSHVYAFDGPRCRRVYRVDQATRVSEPEPSLPGATELGTPAIPARWQRALEHLYASAGHPAAGFVSDQGIVRLPPTVTAAIGAPTTLTFSYFDNGALLVVPERVLQRWAEDDAPLPEEEEE